VTSPTLLIGEDDEFLLQLVKLAFTMEGFRVAVARDGASALALAQSIRPDAALLDLCLPGATGLDVLRVLRGREETRDLPVALMTGCADARTAPVEGAQAFVPKPFTLGALVATVKALLSRAA
jgi:two-component system phosphate regulon response regulator PhoB